MIGNITRGSGFGGLASYLLQGDREAPDFSRVAWTVAENLPSDDPELAAPVMRATAEQNERGIEQPVWHLSLSWHPDDQPSREQMLDAARRVLNQLDLHEHQALIVAHQDTPHPHVHVMVNRVHPETLEVWKGWKDKTRVERALRYLERENGYREVPGRLARLPGQERPDLSRGLTHGEQQQSRREGRDAWAERIRETLRPHFRQAKSWAELEHRLAGHEVRFEKKGRGLVVTDGERQVKASRIDRQGSIHQLERRFEMPFKEWRGQVEELTGAVGRLQAIQERDARIDKVRIRVAARIHGPQRIVNEHSRLEEQIQREWNRLHGQFDDVYRRTDAEPAFQRFRELARREGLYSADKVLYYKPQRLGRLQGRGLGPFRDRERAEALEWRKPALRTVYRIADLEKELRQGRPRVEAAERALSHLRPRMRRLSKARSQLQVPRQVPALQNTIARLGLRMGTEAVRLALPAPVVRVVFAAVKVLQMAQVRERELGRGMER